MSRTKKSALFAVAGGMMLIGIAYISAFSRGGAPSLAPWLLAIGIPCTTVGIMVMGALREGQKLGRLSIPFGLFAVLLAAGFGFALGLPGNEDVNSRLFLGLPLRAAIVVYGIGLLPTVILPIAYALTFESQTLSREDVERAQTLGQAFRKTE
jgi:hypothetical protein